MAASRRQWPQALGFAFNRPFGQMTPTREVARRCLYVCFPFWFRGEQAPVHTQPSVNEARKLVCSECNRLFFVEAGIIYRLLGIVHCPKCGNALIRFTSIVLGFVLGIVWSGLFVAGSWFVASVVGSREIVISVGLAIGSALAAGRLHEASRLQGASTPSSSLAKQVAAEGAGAFVALLIGGGLLLQWLGRA